jgi:hypothetical protein
VLSRLLRLDVEREGAVAVVVELAVGHLVGADALRGEFSGAGPARVQERADLLADGAHAQTLARAHHLAGVRHRRDEHRERRAAHLLAGPLDAQLVVARLGRREGGAVHARALGFDVYREGDAVQNQGRLRIAWKNKIFDVKLAFEIESRWKISSMQPAGLVSSTCCITRPIKGLSINRLSAEYI